MRRRPDGVWICGHCGACLRRRRGIGPLALLAGAVATLGFGLTVLAPPAHVQRRLSGLELPSVDDLPLLLDAPPQLAALLPPPAPGALEGIDEPTLMDLLARADAAWIPRVEPLADGRTRYHYKRRSGDPQLSVAEIRSLILNPPRFGEEREGIRELLAELAGVGVRIQLSQPLKQGAAGEWDPRQRSLRIKPTVMESGSAEFFQVLNHEAIHVAQSCSSGHLRSSPRPLGLSEQVPPALQPVLNDPLYSQASPLERQLEREAYANQHRLGYGATLLRRHCRPADDHASARLHSPASLTDAAP